MAREAYIYRLILDWLKNNKGLQTTHDICEGTGVPYSSVARVVKILAREKRVKKRPGQGSGYLYEYSSHELPEDTKKNQKNFAPVPMPLPPLRASDFVGITMTWVNTGWKPASGPAAKVLVEIMSKFYKFYWLELNRGIAVDQADLDFCKSRLMEARDQVFKFAEFFDRLLNTDQLWDAKTSMSYVLSELPTDSDPIDFCEQARRVEDCIQP